MSPIGRLLIANRGEIAVRVIRTCRALGIETVVAASDADRESLAARLADRAVCIGPSRATESYLNVDAIVHAALATACDAIHPGYGFLSENRALAAACAEHDVLFVGPDVAHLDAVGDKLTARRHAEDAGVPVVPGGTVGSAAEADALAASIGFPVLIKAVAGGGGRGMKRVDTAADLAPMLDLAMAEAQAAFGDHRVYLERFVARGRHVEVQIIGDGHTVLHAGERGCSVQRRYQKVIEEAPAPALPDGMRHRVHAAAVRFARHLGYRSLGTVEFLVDLDRDEFHFLEMNARIQVEHPVTEAITGLDLVALQLSIAAGIPLALTQDDIVVDGHALECRINAEDVAHDFRPSPGRIGLAWFPCTPGLRVDTHVESGIVIGPHYDSMLAKLIVHAPDRAAAIATMDATLRTLRLDGVSTNVDLHRAVLADPAFRAGGVDTRYLTDLLSRPTGTT